MPTWQGILITVVLVIAALAIYDKWIKAKVNA